ncbi:glycosyltransferase [Streptomyces sp. WZ-12]|uniref:glycosyltransferase n=1 Tax=Streptomyces sp. WZ-12 TaxID=3030210 RepID=UPI00238187A2|nr:glycosyltransferase [Streptomyces sp. WZ-12]
MVGLGGWLPGWQPWPYLLLAAPAWLASRPWWQQKAGPKAWSRLANSARRLPAWLYCLGALALTATVCIWLQGNEPHMAHEEAVYANKARSWADGTPDAGWGLYRPFGLPFLGRIALAVHHDVGALRGVAVLLTLATLAVTHLITAHWTTPHRAAVTVLLVVSGLGFLRRAPEFLNDIGATGLLLLVVFLLVRAQEKAKCSALLLLPFAILAAFYFRYGVLGSLIAIALASLGVYGLRAWRKHWRQLLAATGILAAGLLPHFVYAIQETGSPLGIIFSATGQANRDYIGEGLVYYLAIFPYRLAGDLGAIVMTAGLFVAGASARRLLQARRGGNSLPRPRDRRHVFLGLSSVLIFATLGLTAHGEARFVYLPVILLTVLGVEGIVEIAGRWASRALLVVAALAGITIAGTAQVVAKGAMPGPEDLSRSTVPVAREMTSSTSCLLVTGYEPEMGWYSGCDAVTYSQYQDVKPAPGVKTSFILFERGRYQPTSDALRRLIGHRATSVRHIPTNGAVGSATVITVQP